MTACFWLLQKKAVSTLLGAETAFFYSKKGRIQSAITLVPCLFVLAFGGVIVNPQIRVGVSGGDDEAGFEVFLQ